MENVIPIEDLPDFIDRAIAKVSEGVALARSRGILAELPKEIQFDVVLIEKWQSQDMPIIGVENSTSTETGNGTSTSTQTGGSTRTSTESDSGTNTSSDTGQTAGQNNNYTYTD
jgi:hypothetical protein